MIQMATQSCGEKKFRPRYGRKNGNPIATWGNFPDPILNVTPERFQKIGGLMVTLSDSRRLVALWRMLPGGGEE